jgi:hypothetical protein
VIDPRRTETAREADMSASPPGAAREPPSRGACEGNGNIILFHTLSVEKPNQSNANIRRSMSNKRNSQRSGRDISRNGLRVLVGLVALIVVSLFVWSSVW